MRYSNYTGDQTPTLQKPTSASASNHAQRYQGRAEVKDRMTICMGPRSAGGAGADGELMIAEPQQKVKRPSFYKVILLNDDYTPMDFVVSVLEMIFRKSHEDAVNLMLVVHSKGAAVCGAYTRDVAETKVDQVIEYARINDYPLQCVMEEE